MTTPTKHSPTTVGSHLASPLEVGEPDSAGPLTVFPIFGPEPKLDYLAFSQAVKHGVTITELESAASVNDLVVHNPTDDVVLLFDGEEILGAQQNRTLDISVLVAAETKLKIPVSCVEAGRWEGRRHRDAFQPSPQTAYPRLRRMKAMQVSAAVAAGAAARADQGAVWQEADELADRYSTDSPTRAVHHVYEDRRSRLDEIATSIPCHDGQVGAIAAFGGQLAVLDYVSSTEPYRALHPRLVQGYALDALDAGDQAPPERPTASGFALLAADAPLAHHAPNIGLGEDIRFAANGVAGSGLVHDSELVQLTVFPDGGLDGEQASNAQATRIRRPSRRQR